MFKCEIKTGGAAFREPFTGDEDIFCEGEEIIRILRRIEKELENGATRGSVMDINGNKVCNWSR